MFLDKIKVLIADGSVIFRQLIARAVEMTGYGIAKHTASNGAIAIEWIRQCRIDLVLIDVSILEAEGMQVIKKLREEDDDIEIVITSTSERRNAPVVLKALELGAVDFMLKPSGENEYENLESMVSYLKSLFVQIKVKKYTEPGDAVHGISELESERIHTIVQNPGSTKSVSIAEKRIWQGADLVLIASSTGGPQALETVLEGLPAKFKTPVLVVQHMPPEFTKILAHTLDKRCKLSVFEAFDKSTVDEGKIAIAPGGMHMIVESSNDGRRLIRLSDTAFVNGVKPSADVLFRTVADAYKGAKILIVVLTGMGNDGTSGIEEIKRKCDCYCITQSEKTCVVYGMPRSVYEAGLSDEAVDIDEISGRIAQIG